MGLLSFFLTIFGVIVAGLTLMNILIKFLLWKFNFRENFKVKITFYVPFSYFYPTSCYLRCNFLIDYLIDLQLWTVNVSRFHCRQISIVLIFTYTILLIAN
jgi:hypothetical protein